MWAMDPWFDQTNRQIDSLFVRLGCSCRENAHGVTDGLQAQHAVQHNLFWNPRPQRISKLHVLRQFVRIFG